MKLVDGDFVQFYAIKKYELTNSTCYCLFNGFSYVWDEANPRWIKIGDDFEPRNKNVYISVWFPAHHILALKWAARFPKVTFTVGGPMYFYNTIRCESKYWNFPKNFVIKTCLAEDIFDKAIDLKNWKLDFPYKDNPIQYCYYMGLQCYWRKCTFCIDSKFDLTAEKKRSNIGYDLEPLWNAPPGDVYISSETVTPFMMQDILPRLNYRDKNYWLLLRAGQKEYETLNELSKDPRVKMDKITFSIGVEFPSDRMLKLMNKGITVSEYIQMINFLKQKCFRLNLLYMTGWPEITQQDIEDADEFFEKVYMTESSRIISIQGPLARNILSSKTSSTFGGQFYYPQCWALNAEQKILDIQWINLLNSVNSFKRTSEDVKLALQEKE